MYERITLKDIMRINQQFDKGKVINKGSLAYAVSEANRTKSWLRSCAVLSRAVLIDHIFEEGNKRTTAAIITGFFEERNIIYDPEKVARAVTTILMKNITNISTIERVITNAIIR